MHGRGSYIFNDGSYYAGDFVENQAQGAGVYTSKTKETFQGIWVANRLEDNGVDIQLIF